MSTFGAFTVTRASTKNVLGSNGLYQSVANNVPAFEFNADGTYRGLLVEPAATNSIRNNTQVGAVAGTPGTLPTNWSVTLAGLSQEVVGTGSENGVDYIDLRLFGTASGVAADVRFETTTGIVAANAQTWTQSYWLKVVASPTPPVGYFHQMFERTSAGAFVTSGSTSTTVSATLSRLSFTRTLSGGATVERVQPTFGITLVNGATYDFTIRIGLPQMEQSAVATSVIKTTGSTASRVADSVTLTGASSLIGQTEGAGYVEFETRNDATSTRVLTLDDGTANNNLRIAHLNTNTVFFGVNTGGVAQVSITSASTFTSVIKLAFAYNSNDFIAYVNGSSIGTDTGGTVPATSRVVIGSTGSADYVNGWIRAVALYTTRLSNAQLASLTA